MVVDSIVEDRRKTKIILCICEHKFQDKKYGKQQRVHNMTKQSSPRADQRWRCTVCGKEK